VVRRQPAADGSALKLAAMRTVPGAASEKDRVPPRGRHGVPDDPTTTSAGLRSSTSNPIRVNASSIEPTADSPRTRKSSRTIASGTAGAASAASTARSRPGGQIDAVRLAHVEGRQESVDRDHATIL
jgi:hypothetical protein